MKRGGGKSLRGDGSPSARTVWVDLVCFWKVWEAGASHDCERAVLNDWRPLGVGLESPKGSGGFRLRGSEARKG